MPDVLISGPAGANKSAVAREALAAATGLSIAADFQAIYSALLLLERGPDGRYPARVEALLPLTEYVRRAVISGARSRGIGIIATNSDGDPARRALLLSELGAGATERVIDPGEDVVRARLADPVTGNLSPDCGQAINRWYRRRTRGR